MTTIRLRHISRFRDRHGTMRHYLRMPGRKPVPLPGAPGSPEFMTAYQAGLAAPPIAPPPIGAARTLPGSLDALAIVYLASAGFRALRASTQATYRRIVDRLRTKHGTKPVAMLDAIGVRALLEECEGGTAANHRLRVLRLMIAAGIEAGMLASDPSIGVKRRKHTTIGYATWTEAEIEQYETHHPSGSVARLGFALALHTAQRRSDVVRIGRQHVRDGKIELRQVKTGARVRIPIHPALAAELAQVPEDRLTFLTTQAGRPFTANGFYMRFRGWCDAAGIPPGRSPHGLRKATARRMAEAGATTKEIGAVLGDRTLAVIEIYTREADLEMLAASGLARIGNVALPTRKGLEVRRGKKPNK
jgi:integrase